MQQDYVCECMCVCACAHSSSLFMGPPECLQVCVCRAGLCAQGCMGVHVFCAGCVCSMCECVSLPVCLRAGLWAQGLSESVCISAQNSVHARLA